MRQSHLSGEIISFIHGQGIPTTSKVSHQSSHRERLLSLFGGFEVLLDIGAELGRVLKGSGLPAMVT